MSFAPGRGSASSTGETAALTSGPGRAAPAAAFCLVHADLDGDSSVYLSSEMNIAGEEPVISEPAMLRLLGARLASGARRFVRRGRSAPPPP